MAAVSFDISNGGGGYGGVVVYGCGSSGQWWYQW
jgi:hypothetical protein